jgi:acid phosphatase
MRDHVGPILDGRDWRAGRLAIVITADEDDHNQDNLVLTAVLHPNLHHVVVDEPLTHLSLSRFYSEAAGLAPLRDARTAPSLAQAFGLRVR